MGVRLFSQVARRGNSLKLSQGNELPREVVVSPSLEVDVDVALGVTAWRWTLTALG